MSKGERFRIEVINPQRGNKMTKYHMAAQLFLDSCFSSCFRVSITRTYDQMTNFFRFDPLSGYLITIIMVFVCIQAAGCSMINISIKRRKSSIIYCCVIELNRTEIQL